MAFGALRDVLLGNANNVGSSLAATHSGFAIRKGDLIYAVYAEQATNTATDGGTTDNLGNTYTRTSAAADAGTICTGKAYWAVAAADGTITTVTFTTTTSTNNAAASVAVIEGPFKLSPLDANPANTVNDNTTPFTGPLSGTLAFAGSAQEVVMCWIVFNGAVTLTASAPNNITAQQQTQAILTVGVGRQVVTATTSIAPEWTASAGATQTCYGTTSFMGAGSAVDTKAGIFFTQRNEPTRRGLSDKVASKAHAVFDAITDPIFIPAVAAATVAGCGAAAGALVVPSLLIYNSVTAPVLPPEAAVVITTPEAFGYQTVEPFAKKVGKKLSEPFAAPIFPPTVVGATPDIFGYQTVPPFAKPQKAKLSEPVAWDPQTITPAAAAPAVTGALGDSTATVRNTWLVYDTTAWTPQPIVAVVAQPTLGYQPSDLLRKWRAKRRQSPSSFVFALPIDDYGFQPLEAYAKPIRKRLSEPFAWDPQQFVFTPTPDIFGYQTVPSFAKPIPRKLSEAFAWDPQVVAPAVVVEYAATAAAQSATIINTILVYNLTVLVITPPTAVVVTPDAFGYQTVPSFAKPIYKRLSEPFTWVREPPTPTPSVFGYQTVEPFAKPIFKRLSEAFAWGPQGFVFAPTPDVFGYQDVAPFAKPIAKKLSEPFIWNPQFVVQLPPAPPVVGGVQPPGYWYEEWERLGKRQRERKRRFPETIVIAEQGIPAAEIAPYEPDKTFRVSPTVIQALAQAQSIDDIRALARQETGQVRNMLNMIIAEHKRRMKDEADVEIILLMS